MIQTDGRKTIANAPARPDFHVRSEGTIFLVTPLSADGKDWLIDHVEAEAQFFGQALAVDHRYIYDLVDGIFDAGFTIE